MLRAGRPAVCRGADTPDVERARAAGTRHAAEPRRAVDFRRMSRVFSVATGRRTKWMVVVVWVIVAAIAGSFAGKFEEGQENEQSSFLPGNAESVRALEQTERFPSGDNAPVVVVYRNDDGLTQADL